MTKEELKSHVESVVTHLGEFVGNNFIIEKVVGSKKPFSPYFLVYDPESLIPLDEEEGTAKLYSFESLDSALDKFLSLEPGFNDEELDSFEYGP